MIEGAARIDFKIRNGVPHVIEINSCPGMAGIFQAQLLEGGFKVQEFFGMMIEESLRRGKVIAKEKKKTMRQNTANNNMIPLY